MSQTVKALISLRELILSGDLEPGAQVLEVALVERLGVSRTPIRAALLQLSTEGLLEKLPGGGYVVRAFTERDIQDAIELRGTVEGIAARLAAERGVGALALDGLRECIAGVEPLLETTALSSDSFERYFEFNALFHQRLLALAESFVLERTIANVVTLPFAAPNAFVIAQSKLDQAWKVLFTAQEQHKAIIEAIEQREGARAEAMAREHARLSLRTLSTALKHSPALSEVPGFKLIAGSVA
jgi:GntR family transcriptional regulator, vanillate catabolism transcriptional regulator